MLLLSWFYWKDIMFSVLMIKQNTIKINEMQNNLTYE